MIFENMWPLALLLAVPSVVILYLLKPKGKDYRISSILLWEKMFRNRESKTFLEKFVHNVLMYLQILMILLLVLALMSPYVKTQGKGGGNVILVLDTGGSMQHDAGDGRTRLEEAVAWAKDLIASSDGTAFSIVASDCLGTELVAVGVKDKDSLYGALDRIECCDGPGNLQGAEGVVETLRGADMSPDGDGRAAEVIVLTDGNGAGDAMGFAEYFGAQVLVVGDAVNNVANNFLTYTEGEGEGGIACASSLTNYGDTDASMEVSLYEGERLVEIKRLSVAAGETALCFFQEFIWQGEPLRSEVGSVKFNGTDQKDSLAEDNAAYAVPGRKNRISAVLIGDGNTYIEKAYQAAFGESLVKAADGEAWQEALREGEHAVCIYDAGEEGLQRDTASGMYFFDGFHALDTVEGVLLTVTDCELVSGLGSFAIGVNETRVYDVPEWGTGFLWAGGMCAGYYGEHDGVKTVVVGFDLRESDFPLKAEFPVFMSNAFHYLGDTSLLAQEVYMAGDRVLFHPQADFDVNTLEAETRKAGLYEITAGDISERYVVRFDTESLSDGRVTAEGTGSFLPAEGRTVKGSLRNIVLALLLVLMAAEWFLYMRQTRCRGRFYPAVRIIGVVMLVLALLGISVTIDSGANTTVFLVDISDSNEQNLPEMEAYLDEAIREMPEENQYAIVTFGKNSVVDQFLTEENRFTRIMSLPDKTATNFEDAMSRALAMIPAEGAGRVVILTDGRQTKGQIANTASALTARQVELLAHVYGVEQGRDVYVDSVELPGVLYQNDAYSMTVTVVSNYGTAAEIQIWMGSMEVESHEVYLNRGVNQFRFRQQVRGENIENFEVRVEAPGDTRPENNSYHAFSVVDSVPKVLLVSGMYEDSSRYEQLLRSANCNYDRVSAINAPASLEELLEYKSVILENVSLWDLPEGFLEHVETYVKDYGCGLVCCGGEDSYCLGGYRDSVLETLLPVDMELRGVNEIPSMAMIMVIDHSGSMSMDMGGGATNLDLAITAAKAAVDQMRSSDYVGVLTFDDKFTWVVEPVQASDKKAIKAQIETVADGGGTSIQPALWAALKGAADCDVSIRHVVLLTDGQGESRNYNDIISAYTDGSVTLSAVAVGQDSDKELLKRIAEDCGGRFYYSDMASDIPKIFAQEVFLSGDTYLQNGVFGLAASSRSEITRGLFAEGWPVIYGYVSATPKANSSVLIASEKSDPVLTTMQYGLGHTVAWNSDVTNKWTAEYAGKEDYAQLWRRIIDYSIGSASMGEDTVDVTTAGGYTNIIYRARDYGEGTKVEAVYTDPDGATRTIPLHATSLGVYEARLDADMAGIYNLSVRRMEGDTCVNAVTTAAAVQYSDEYKFGVDDTAFTSFVERYGAMADSGENIWKKREGRVKERLDLTQWLLLGAFMWFLMDIALRRFRFRPQDTSLYRRVSAYRKMRAERRNESLRTGLPAGEKTAKEPQESAPMGRRDGATEVARERSGGKGADKKSRKKPEPQVLDTSALLKKKDQRNQ